MHEKVNQHDFGLFALSAGLLRDFVLP